MASDAYNIKNIENMQQTRLIVLKTKNIGTKEEVLDRKKKTWIDVIEFYPIEDYLKEKDTSGLSSAKVGLLSGPGPASITSSSDTSSVSSSSSSDNLSIGSFVTAKSKASSNSSQISAISISNYYDSLFGAFGF